MIALIICSGDYRAEAFTRRRVSSQTIPTKVGIQVDNASRIYAMIAPIICSSDYRAEAFTGRRIEGNNEWY
jgi:hypothetical protein